MAKTPPLAAPTKENPWQVHELSQTLGNYIDRLGGVWLEAQIAQLTLRPGARTAYITLRDVSNEVSLSAVALRNVLVECDPPPAEGDHVIIKGKIEFHSLRGSLQVRIESIQRMGVGQLLARIAQLREILRAAGLFDPARKKPLPVLPKGLGLITGRDSAAEKDVLEVSTLRYPGVTWKVVHTLVQGTHAAKQIISALEELDADPEVEVIVIARGGGSVEDLLPFSDEELCRAVAAAGTPIVSAIGHESDHPLLDDVADVRAATPTDAAKRVTPDVALEIAGLDSVRTRLKSALKNWLLSEEKLLTTLSNRPIFSHPQETLLQYEYEKLDGLSDRLRGVTLNSMEKKFTDIDYLHNQLISLSPRGVLARGFSLLEHNNTVITSVAELAVHQEVTIIVSDGSAHAHINSLHPTPKGPHGQQ